MQYKTDKLLLMATITLTSNEQMKKDLVDFIYNSADTNLITKLYKQVQKAITSRKSIREEEDSEEYILAGVTEACKEMKLAREGKLHGIGADDYIKMLENED